MSDTKIVVRPAVIADVPFILKCIRDLAEYEKALDQVEATEEMLADELFNNPRRCTEALIAEVHATEGTPAALPEAGGFAMFFHNFSTWKGRRGIYVEDIFVLPSMRGKGLGSHLLGAVAKIAEERKCGRMDWQCLDWNTPSLNFYLGPSVGADKVEGWAMLRLGTDEQIANLARQR